MKLSTARYLRKLAVAKFDMTTVPTVTMTPNSDTKAEGDENIVIRGKFKSVNLFNDTIHIILYPHDGLRTAARLQEIDEGADVVLDLKKNAFKHSG